MGVPEREASKVFTLQQSTTSLKTFVHDSVLSDGYKDSGTPQSGVSSQVTSVNFNIGDSPLVTARCAVQQQLSCFLYSSWDAAALQKRTSDGYPPLGRLQSLERHPNLQDRAGQGRIM